MNSYSGLNWSSAIDLPCSRPFAIRHAPSTGGVALAVVLRAADPRPEGQPSSFRQPDVE